MGGLVETVRWQVTRSVSEGELEQWFVDSPSLTLRVTSITTVQPPLTGVPVGRFLNGILRDTFRILRLSRRGSTGWVEHHCNRQGLFFTPSCQRNRGCNPPGAVGLISQDK